MEARGPTDSFGILESYLESHGFELISPYFQSFFTQRPAIFTAWTMSSAAGTTRLKAISGLQTIRVLLLRGKKIPKNPTGKRIVKGKRKKICGPCGAFLLTHSKLFLRPWAMGHILWISSRAMGYKQNQTEPFTGQRSFQIIRLRS